MDTKVGGIHFGKTTFGAVTSLSGAEAVQFISATSNLVRTLATAAVVGGVGIGLAALLVAAFGGFSEDRSAEFEDMRKRPNKVGLGSGLVKIVSGSKRVMGVLLDKEISLKTRNNELVASLNVITLLRNQTRKTSLISPQRSIRSFCFDTVDGSQYDWCTPLAPSVLRICSSVGIQKICLTGLGETFEIYRQEVDNVEQVRGRVNDVISSNFRIIVETIGPENSERLFGLKGPERKELLLPG